MTQRLIWNFEITPEASSTHMPRKIDKSPYNWEARHFFTQHEIIVMPINILLSEGKLKHHSDQYFIHHIVPQNIKYRKNNWLYKKLIDQQNGLSAFDKKEILPNPPNLDEGRKFIIEKEALSIKLHDDPEIILELSYIQISSAQNTAAEIYYSACIEGKSSTLVNEFNQIIFKNHPMQNYTDFLKNLPNQQGIS
jgi:hypothetical protein